jgi:hypothetical protein
MKNTIVLMVIISAFFLTGCATNSQTTEDKSDGSELTIKTDNEFLIPEAGINIVLPEEYTITKNTENNRRGSFVSYDFALKALPSHHQIFQEIQFFSEESIKQYTSNCGNDGPCFFGDYPDLTRYNGQKYAFNNKESYSSYELKKFDDRYYFVSNFKCTGDSCVIREYTTFIGDTKIDTWINMENDAQADQADLLFKKFEILE